MIPIIIDPFSYKRIPEHRDTADRIMKAAGVHPNEVVEIWVAEGMVAIRRVRVREAADTRHGTVVTFEVESGEPSYYLTVRTPDGWVDMDDDGTLPHTLNDPVDIEPLLAPAGIEVRKRRHFTFEDAELDIWRPGYGWV